MTQFAERERIERVLARDGRERAMAWACRTEALYRAAVLDRTHFAHTGDYRRRFIEAYLALKRFALRGTSSLRSVDDGPDSSAGEPGAGDGG